uniref:Uncharacterized protein n=1 Tax=Triticum urartu TaxID=4572 RepID=A0A8R7TG90_TRIUA
MRGQAKGDQSMETKYLSNCLQGWLYDLCRLPLLCSAGGALLSNSQKGKSNFILIFGDPSCRVTTSTETNMQSRIYSMGFHFSGKAWRIFLLVQRLLYCFLTFRSSRQYFPSSAR